MGGIILKKNGSRLEFILDKQKDKSISYDFKDNSFTSFTGRNVKLSTIKSMFSKFGYEIDGIESDPVYNKLFEVIGRTEYVYNLGTKLEKLYKYRYTEKYLSQGYNVDKKLNGDDERKISTVSKLVKKVYLKNNTNIKYIGAFGDNDKIGVLLEEINNRYDSNFMNTFLEDYRISSWCDNIKRLLVEYRYNPKSLANYICNIVDYEALGMYSTVWYLIDFLSMNTQMGATNIEKYPRHLHTTHDIVVRNFNAFKVVHDKEMFNNIRREDLEYIQKDYSIIYPKCYTEIQKEGAQLSHCVASYVDRVIKGEIHILFLRKSDKLDDSLVTVEIRNGVIVQFKGAYNRNLSPEEMEFLNRYAKNKKLKIAGGY